MQKTLLKYSSWGIPNNGRLVLRVPALPEASEAQCPAKRAGGRSAQQSTARRSAGGVIISVRGFFVQLLRCDCCGENKFIGFDEIGERHLGYRGNFIERKEGHPPSPAWRSAIRPESSPVGTDPHRDDLRPDRHERGRPGSGAGAWWTIRSQRGVDAAPSDEAGARASPAGPDRRDGERVSGCPDAAGAGL